MSCTHKSTQMPIKLVFIWKVSHLDSLWNRGRRQLGNGLFERVIPANFIPRLNRRMQRFFVQISYDSAFSSYDCCRMILHCCTDALLKVGTHQGTCCGDKSLRVHCMLQGQQASRCTRSGLSHRRNRRKSLSAPGNKLQWRVFIGSCLFCSGDSLQEQCTRLGWFCPRFLTHKFKLAAFHAICSGDISQKRACHTL